VLAALVWLQTGSPYANSQGGTTLCLLYSVRTYWFRQEPRCPPPKTSPDSVTSAKVTPPTSSCSTTAPWAPTARNLADALLASCEWEYSMLQGWFGAITPASLPFNVYIDPGSFGAYHANCAATEIHCAAFSGTDPDIVRLVLAAEVDEVFMAAQAKGWN